MAKPFRILVLNGPNLNMLGVREPETYGNATLGDVEDLCRETAEALGVEADCRQSNHEGELVQWIQEARTTHIGLVINAGGYSHTSVAIHDAILAAGLPTVEVHVSNIYAREAFRHHSTISAVARGVISGLGIQGYGFAMRHLARFAVQTDIYNG